MKFKPVVVAMIAMMPMLAVDFADAAFGRSSSSGVSRSYSRPSTPSVSKSSSYSAPKTYNSTPSYSQPRSTYSAPKQTYQSQPQQYRQQYNNNSGYSNNSYNNGGYKPRSTMGDIGVGVASVAGGMLAAQAITSLISSPGHAGLYTHPQYPGQYFNAQGVPQQAPQQQQSAQAPVQPAVLPAQQQGYVEQPQYAPQVQQPVYVQPKEKGFFSYLWSGLFSILHLIFFGAVVAGLAYLGFRTFRKGKQVIDDQNAYGSMDKHKKDLTNKAQDLFSNIQEKSNNMAFLKANTKYLPIADMMDEPSSVVQFEQGAVDVAVESGKVRGSVLYRATLKKADGSKENIREYWNFENENGVWKLIGIDQA
ncbi:hypothetical protein D3C75_495770 [compost metagenome]